MHDTNNIQLTAYIKSYHIIWHHTVYCLHPSVLHEEGLHRGLRYLAQQYFMITIVYKFHNYRNNNRWSLIQHISHCQFQVFLQRNEFKFFVLHLYMVTAIRVVGAANSMLNNTGDVHIT